MGEVARVFLNLVQIALVGVKLRCGRPAVDVVVLVKCLAAMEKRARTVTARVNSSVIVAVAGALHTGQRRPAIARSPNERKLYAAE